MINKINASVLGLVLGVMILSQSTIANANNDSSQSVGIESVASCPIPAESVFDVSLLANPYKSGTACYCRCEYAGGTSACNQCCTSITDSAMRAYCYDLCSGAQPWYGGNGCQP